MLVAASLPELPGLGTSGAWLSGVPRGSGVPDRGRSSPSGYFKDFHYSLFLPSWRPIDSEPGVTWDQNPPGLPFPPVPIIVSAPRNAGIFFGWKMNQKILRLHHGQWMTP